MNSIKGYTEAKCLTEEEFFRRELNIELRYDADPSSQEKTHTIIVTADPRPWLQHLRNATPKSKIFILVGNETYEPWKYELLNGLPSINLALIYNPPKAYRFGAGTKSLLGNIIDGGFLNLSGKGNPVRDFRTATYKRKITRSIKMDYDWLELPQGYSNNFAKQVVSHLQSKNVILEKDQSLLNSRVVAEIRKTVSRDHTFSYIGQNGNHRRSTCLRIAAGKSKVVLHHRQGFHGTSYSGDHTYLELLQSSKFTLVPPGFFNNSNHRYLESLIFGKLPAILYQNSLDISTNNNWTKTLGFPYSHSFRFLLSALEKMDESQYCSILNTAFSFEMKIITDLRVLLSRKIFELERA